MACSVVKLCMQTKPCPAVCRENLILNELIREYLEFNQYSYTAVVLDAGEHILCVSYF